MPSVDFYYDFVSPYSYLACCRMPAFNWKHQAGPQWMGAGCDTTDWSS
ncbi:MAG: hypothetical protein Q9M27_02885 [Mariprofundaceae bacterium]|nr:hypothetical protein [Mariprofundaceae bacterium]